jgi:3-hydroxybutyryl-CoA dehydrogenase
MNAPRKVAIIGGGTMGAGIAQAFADIGSMVMVVESNPTAVAAAHARISDGIAKSAERDKLSLAPHKVLANIRLVTDIGDVDKDSSLVIEAVQEVAAAKIAVLTRAEKVVDADAILASNTSSLSITNLAAALARPERFLGMHFFNPVPVSKLVEVVVTPTTDAAARDTATNWVAALGKTTVVVNDSPGFATSRLGVLLGLEAIRMLEEGVADAPAIDAAMELGYRHPMGPLRSTDLVGLDVRLAIAEHLHATLGDRFAPPQLLRDKVACGELGQKTGQGFYDWT